MNALRSKAQGRNVYEIYGEGTIRTLTGLRNRSECFVFDEVRGLSRRVVW